MEATFDTKKAQEFVQKNFTQSALPSLQQYIKIPNLSRNFDANWNTNGLLEKAADHIKTWVENVGIKQLSCQIIKEQGLSPIIYTQIQGTIDQTFLFYGHFDKQPPMQGWWQGFQPCKPIIKDDKLYGRGGADDGYATYGTMLAIKAVQQQGLPIPRCVMITQGDQESGSGHMGTYLPKLKDKIGNPTVIFCLDSGCLDYQRLWVTNSLRGVVLGTLRVDVLTEGIHSGDASGVVPSSFRIIRQLLERLQSSKNGDMHESFQVDIPSNRYQQMYELVQQMQKASVKDFPMVQGLKRVWDNQLTSLITRGWKSQMAIIGASGLPSSQNAGNVMLPWNQVVISIRIPPTKKPKQAEKQFVKILTEYPPYNAKVTLSKVISATGFNAPQCSKALDSALNEASECYFGKKKLALNEGMSIPLLGNMNNLWPEAQFVVTGVLGPQSNAHGPNQFLHLPYVKKLICCMAYTLAKVSTQKK